MPILSTKIENFNQNETNTGLHFNSADFGLWNFKEDLQMKLNLKRTIYIVFNWFKLKDWRCCFHCWSKYTINIQPHVLKRITQITRDKWLLSYFHYHKPQQHSSIRIRITCLYIDIHIECVTYQIANNFFFIFVLFSVTPFSSSCEYLHCSLYS